MKTNSLKDKKLKNRKMKWGMISVQIARIAMTAMKVKRITKKRL